MKNSSLRHLLSLIDLTSLNAMDTDASIHLLCRKAITHFGHVAAVCIDPSFVKVAHQALADTPVKIATVANFPGGDDSLESTVMAIQQAIQCGAQEIDVVFPYRSYLAGERELVQAFIRQCKAVCGDSILLKVILESGILADPQVITDASRDALLAGADFLKTSTGKISIGATLEAATAMLMTIKEMTYELKRSIGFKVSGGIRTVEQAEPYIILAEEILGADFVVPKTFRIGASQLLDQVVEKLL